MAQSCESPARPPQRQLLTSPAFIFALWLLLLNDFFIKRYWHGPVSGKLSDFAGLFVFPLFWVAVLPRARKIIYGLTAGLFVLWKSSASQPLIDAWNALTVLNISRVVDYTDLLALTVLPLSFAYSLRPCRAAKEQGLLYVIGFVSVFAFAATSFSSKTAYDTQYSFPVSKQELLERMKSLSTNEVWDTFWQADDFEITFDDCVGQATVGLSEIDTQSVITLREINYRCPSPPAKQQMQQYFENEFINKLKVTPVMKSPQVQYIWGIPKKPNPEPSASPTRSRAGSEKPRS